MLDRSGGDRGSSRRSLGRRGPPGLRGSRLREGDSVLRLRMICPVDRTEEVLQLLAAESAVTQVMCVRGAAVAPAGDLIAADVSRAAADGLIARLRILSLIERGSISLESPGTILSMPETGADFAAAGGTGEAVVWEQIRNQVRRASQLTPTFLSFLTIAFLLSAVGVTTASPLTLVGAMVVGPEFQPLAALSVGLVRRDRHLIRGSLRTLAISFPAAMLVTAASTLLWVRLGWIGIADVENARSFDFIYEVGPFSLIVALLAGAAGMLALVTSTSAVLVGVFISVTTVPAAGLAVVAAIAGKWHVAASSLAQLGINLTGIVLAGVAVLLLRPRIDGVAD